MPRIARGLIDGVAYHVLNRGNGGQRIFHDDHDYRSFLGLMRDACKLHSVRILAYCLMPDHFHLLLLPGRGAELSKWMQWLMTSHVRHHHCHYGTSGHIWQGRFRSFIVQNDDHLLNVASYVESNPVRSGLAASVEEWAWSSHGKYSGITPHSVAGICPHALPSHLTLLDQTSLASEETERISQSIIRQSPYGDKVWQEQVCRELGLESTIRRRGRPRKGTGKVACPLF